MTNSSTETTAPTTNAAVAAPAATVTPKKAAATRKPTTKKVAPNAKKAAKAAKPAGKKTSNKKVATAAVPREFSKKQIVLDMLRAKGGATMAEIMAKTDWQAHSVRGFISTAGKTYKIASEKTDAGRRYKIAGK